MASYLCIGGYIQASRSEAFSSLRQPPNSYFGALGRIIWTCCLMNSVRFRSTLWTRAFSLGRKCEISTISRSGQYEFCPFGPLFFVLSSWCFVLWLERWDRRLFPVIGTKQ